MSTPSRSKTTTNYKILSSVVGFSRIGSHRELKRCLEEYWNSPPEADSFFNDQVQELQINRWKTLLQQGLDLIPSGDFSLYDQLLDVAFMANCVPQRFRGIEQVPSFQTYFAMARGYQFNSIDLTALPMKKWFDTNYHYIVPVIEPNCEIKLLFNKPLNDFNLAKERLGLMTKPVIIGPLTFIVLSHIVGVDKIQSNDEIFSKLLSVYSQVVTSLVEAGAMWIQIDEPIFCIAHEDTTKSWLIDCFARLASELQKIASSKKAHIIFATYFGSIVGSGNLAMIQHIPKEAGIHLDLVANPEQLSHVLECLTDDTYVSLGLIDGRNVWLTDLQQVLEVASTTISKFPSHQFLISSSCSLLHVPHSVESEFLYNSCDPNRSQILSWLAFGIEKVQELVLLTSRLNGGPKFIASKLERNSILCSEHQKSPLVHDEQVSNRLKTVMKSGITNYFRKSTFTQRTKLQQKQLHLPIMPLTTVGSFPQSTYLRSMRCRYKSRNISEREYIEFIQSQIEKCIRLQEELGFDLLVAGEFERADMVEYFAERMKGFVVTYNGWVQSYGSRCIKPPILYGDVSRPSPMSIDVAKFAQSLTCKPVKGIITGPATMIKWSFVRTDQSLKDTLFQVAMAIRDEIQDLESAGISSIQIDEPGFQEILPLDLGLHLEYLKMTNEAFRLASGCLCDETQLCVHMCYSDVSKIFRHVINLDSDLISLECARSKLNLKECIMKQGEEHTFEHLPFIAPGLYDVHSPRIPTKTELEGRIKEFLKVIPKSRLVINPDCGLKTRTWQEAEESIRVMAKVASALRQETEIGGEIE